MTVFDCFNFEQMEKFILEKNRVLNCFEDQILQARIHHFVEKELFFIVKDSHANLSCEELLSRYSFLLQGNYSPHQIPRVAVCNESGDVLIETSEFSHFASKSAGQNHCFFEMVSHIVLRKFPSSLEEGKDYQTLYENDFIKIIVFLLRVSRIFSDSNGNRHFYQNGYYVESNLPSEILLYREPYDYYYQMLGYDFLREQLGENDFEALKSFYFSDYARTLKK